MKTPKKPIKKSEVNTPGERTNSLSELDQKGSKRPFDDDEDEDTDFDLPLDDFDTFESFDDDDDDDKY